MPLSSVETPSKVGVVFGIHPLMEPFPRELGYSLLQDRIPGVHPIDANPVAAHRGVQCVDMNMARAFPGSPSSRMLEERAAARVVTICQKQKFDVILDIHTNPYDGCDAAYAFVHNNYSVTSNLALGVAGLLQFTRVIRVSNRNVGWALPQAVCIDISKDSPFMSVDHWRKELEWLTSVDLSRGHKYDSDGNLEEVYEYPPLDFYSHVATSSCADAQRCGWPEEMPGFGSLPLSEVERTRLGYELYAVTWGNEYAPVRGEVVQKARGGLRFGTPQCCDFHEQGFEQYNRQLRAKANMFNNRDVDEQ